ncbi:MAG: Gldg family protein, partial [Lachnospiraceae bacterium]|nr:Gldg family protein [Lachnospiraceae bacterium]
LSNHITVEYKDMENYPNFSQDYLDSSEEAAEQSIIVVCGDKYRYLSSDNFVNYSYDYTTYTQSADSLALESLITEAINYVVSDDTPIIYTLTGHNESTFSSTTEGYIQADNYEVKDLNLLTEDAVPEDCEILFINGPTTDISKEDAKKILTYLEGDGKLYFVANASAEDLPNFKSILKEYGITMEDGIVVEGDSNMYMQMPTYLLPSIGTSDITSAISNQYVLVPISKGFTHGDDTDDYTITSLLSTSESAYSKVNTSSDVIEKEDEDIAGPFDVALQVDTEDGGKIIALGCVNLLEEQIDEAVSGTNTDFVLNGINYLAQQESKISVRAKSLTTNTATLTAFAQKALMVGTTFVLPAFIILVGIVVIVRRRRK